MYHRLAAPLDPLRDPGEDVYTVAPERFEEQLDVMARGAIQVLHFERIAEGWLAGRPSPERSVAITFDDGHDSDHGRALPALLSRGLRAAFFITPAWIGTAGHLEWNQARELLDRGMVVGAHGLDHTLLSSLPESQVRFQLREARRLMHARLGRWPEFLSLPGGAGGAKTVKIAKEEGYRVVAGSVPRRCGRARVGQALPRFALRREDTLDSFRRLVEQRHAALLRAAIRYHLLTRLREVLGGTLYERLRHSWARRVARP